MILSLDPGSSKIGWAVTDLQGQVKDYGFLSPVTDTPKSLGFNLKMNLLIRRLIPIFEDIMKRHKVTHVVWEMVPSFGSMANRELVQATATTLKVLTFKKKLPYQHFTPQTWHKLLTGNAKAPKEEIKSWVIENTILLLDEKMTYDVYDAIAIGQASIKKNEWINNELL
jgi:Holliday junction resolvasome RuvABC endonuclease subunit